MRIEFGLSKPVSASFQWAPRDPVLGVRDGFSPSNTVPDSTKERMAMIKAGLFLRPELPGRKELLSSLQSHGLSGLTKSVEEAYDFAKTHHRGQKRDDGTDYYHHSVRTALRVIEDFGVTNVDSIRGALLHDVMEDTNVSQDLIRSRFGQETAALVGHMSKPDRMVGETYPERNHRYVSNLEAVGNRDLIAIKLADRLDNIEDTHLMPDRTKITRYLQDTKDHYTPLAARHFPDVVPKLESRMHQIQNWLNATP